MLHWWLSVAISLAGSCLAWADHLQPFAQPLWQLGERETTDINIDPNEVEYATRVAWCNNQIATCATLCSTTGVENDSCDHNTLDYACTCSNGTAPGLQYYTATMPTYICERSYEDCMADAEDSTEENDCKTNIKSQCGTLDPATVTKKEGAASSSATGTATGAETKGEPAATGDTTAASTSSSSSDSASEGMTKIGIGIAVAVVGILLIGGVAFACFRFGKKDNSAKGDKHGSEKTDLAIASGPYAKLDSELSDMHYSGHELDSKETPVEIQTHWPVVYELYGSEVNLAELHSDSSSAKFDEEGTKLRMPEDVHMHK